MSFTAIVAIAFLSASIAILLFARFALQTAVRIAQFRRTVALTA